jgi:hypothetical protein
MAYNGVESSFLTLNIPRGRFPRSLLHGTAEVAEARSLYAA